MIRPLVVVGLLFVALLSTPSAVAAADCQMTADPVPGRTIDVAGTAWPAGAGVTFVVIRNGAQDATETLRIDATGSFSVSVDAGPGRGGAYTLIATSGTCKAVADVVAVETAGGGKVGGVQPTPPPTDTLGPAQGAGVWGAAPLVAFAIFAGLALGGFLAATRVRSRAAGPSLRRRNGGSVGQWWR